MNKILPGKTIGILGGGQLGRMLCIAAKELGYRTVILTPKTREPASAEEIADEIIYAEYNDEKSLKILSDKSDIISFEFENIPKESIEFLERINLVRPSSKAIYVAQNRARERKFFKDNSLPTHRFENINSGEEAVKFLKNNKINKAVIKTADFGYDGKGQLRVSLDEDIENLWKKSGFKKAVIEEFIEFDKEISVILARKESGQTSILPIGENIHDNGILKKSVIPADLSARTRENAVSIAKKISDLLNYIGVIAIEFFVLKDGKLYINEIAPRVHNSGHWSMDGCNIDQFKMHIKAICGLEIEDPKLITKQVIMENIIGFEINDIKRYDNLDKVFIHDYKKREVKPGRKLAHVNILK